MAVQSKTPSTASSEVTIRPLREEDLAAADHVMRVAFGTFVGFPEPASFMGDKDYVRTRWRARPDAAFGAVDGAELVGSNFATRWGSVGFFGPLTIRPDYWDRGVGKRLMEPVMACFDRWGTTHDGLFTFAQSQKHVGLYQRFGFWPRFLTAIMSRPVAPSGRAPDVTTYSGLDDARRAGALDECRRLTNEILDGLDLCVEIEAAAEQNLGDTVLLRNDGDLAGFAVCHCGPGTEAGGGTCYVKFGATRPGPTAARDFERLLVACESLASERGLDRIEAGVSTARHEAYRLMLERGFRTDMQGVSMHRPNEAALDRGDVFAMNDWR